VHKMEIFAKFRLPGFEAENWVIMEILIFNVVHSGFEKQQDIGHQAPSTLEQVPFESAMEGKHCCAG
jgi:hypothetical protein